MNYSHKPSVVTYTCYPSIWEAKTGQLLLVQDQPGLKTEFTLYQIWATVFLKARDLATDRTHVFFSIHKVLDAIPSPRISNSVARVDI